MHTYIHTIQYSTIQYNTIIHAYIHTCVRPYIHTYMHTSQFTHIHTYIHTYIHIHILLYMNTYIHAYIHTYKLGQGVEIIWQGSWTSSIGGCAGSLRFLGSTHTGIGGLDISRLQQQLQSRSVDPGPSWSSWGSQSGGHTLQIAGL